MLARLGDDLLCTVNIDLRLLVVWLFAENSFNAPAAIIERTMEFS
jgi:hypothetical protein